MILVVGPLKLDHNSAFMTNSGDFIRTKEKLYTDRNITYSHHDNTATKLQEVLVWSSPCYLDFHSPKLSELVINLLLQCTSALDITAMRR